MKKNVIIVLIDCLSKWYIDQVKTEENFWGKLEKNTYCCNRMFSGAPFTEGAMGELFASEETLRGVNYLSKYREFSNSPFYELFKGNGYFVYFSFLSDIAYAKYGDNYCLEKSDYKEAAFPQYLNIFQTYMNLWDRGAFSKKDYWKMEYALERYFREFGCIQVVKQEKENYKKDKEAYINDLLARKENSLFVNRCMKREMVIDLQSNGQNDLKQLLEEPVSKEEAFFLSKMRYKNLEYLLQTKRNNDEKNAEITGNLYNRDIHCEHRCLLDNRYHTYGEEKKIQGDLEDFINWYDHEGRQLGKPFIAYIHSMHFHWRDIFVDNYYKERDAYIEEICSLTKHIDDLKWQKMSVGKQLAMESLEKHLKAFWKDLGERGLFDNSIVILTADHGIQNYMLHGNEGGTYRRTAFNVPFYMAGKGIVNQVDNHLRSAKDILPTLIDECNLQIGSNHYIGKNIRYSGANAVYSAWMCGTPDFDRGRITCGIRNNRYSITCFLHPTQFLMTGKILAIYDLKDDPDECNNLVSTVSIPEARELFIQLKDKWFDTVMMILTDENNPWKFSKRFEFLKEKEEHYRNINKGLRKKTWNELEEMAGGKEIIIFGAGLHTEKLLADKRFTYPVKEIWDNDSRKAGSYMLGNKILLPNCQNATEDTIILITSRFEFEIVEQLEKMGISQYEFAGLYVNGIL